MMLGYPLEAVNDYLKSLQYADSKIKAIYCCGNAHITLGQFQDAQRMFLNCQKKIQESSSATIEQIEESLTNQNFLVGGLPAEVEQKLNLCSRFDLENIIQYFCHNK
jgi:hypothetical protein